MLQRGSVTVMVKDVESAIKFYNGVLGLAISFDAAPHYAEVELSGLTIGLHPHSPKGPAAGTEGSMSIGFKVEDIDAAIAALKSKGVSFSGGPTDDGFVKLAFFGDPDGNALYLAQDATPS